ncbi:uncharacterized protein JN550_007155 [Neoarthrinium moseri]|uniref:uncharacterized protein n=1 Tax=Neoarthrinium moseri TaxID=1658444 RepID=UPI001FDB938D|nr:uncharacterized protein JN550_007155 [Neoarthrinium moseri]KAI1867103.1 hypothetical protein JN550_007155 [Neoarthrinium moseri]
MSTTAEKKEESKPSQTYECGCHCGYIKFAMTLSPPLTGQADGANYKVLQLPLASGPLLYIVLSSKLDPLSILERALVPSRKFMFERDFCRSRSNFASHLTEG